MGVGVSKSDVENLAARLGYCLEIDKREIHEEVIGLEGTIDVIWGRLTLLKSVLSTLLVYFFSLFHTPSNVISLLKKLRRIFFWGGSSNDTKISWVKWEFILVSYGEGGLNIGSLKAKNWALVGKWWWHFRTESNTLWVRVIKSIYGRDGGLGQENLVSSAKGNSVWGNIIKIGKDSLNIGLNFNVLFDKKLGDGRDTFFWEDIWVGGMRLKDRFSRLFRLEVNQMASVKDRVTFIKASWEFLWQWSRNLTGRLVGELKDLGTLILGFTGLDHGEGKWICKVDNSEVYKTRVMTRKIEDLLLAGHCSNTSTMRNKLLPQKVGLFIWRVLKERIPVRV
ncbi:uncharacterized protein [Rutidosis leptorrhynchoides]|uniref:uncharacterized protein n=1 Tax=Rutidosis leptorrhynchoides TaxID=125765 RepID=UPI003A9956B8